MRAALATVVLGLSGLVTACQAVPDPAPNNALDQQLDELLTWFPGVYDNGQQVTGERLGDLAQDLRHNGAAARSCQGSMIVAEG